MIRHKIKIEQQAVSSRHQAASGRQQAVAACSLKLVACSLLQVVFSFFSHARDTVYGCVASRALSRVLRIVFVVSLWSLVFSLWSVHAAACTGDGCVSNGASKGLAVEPGEMVLSQIVPGTTYDLAQRGDVYVTIFNESGKDCMFKVAAALPAAYGLTPKSGYSAIPDVQWVTLEKSEVKVAAYSIQKIGMRVLVPDTLENYNKKWCVVVAVSSVPANGENIGLRVTPAYYLETIAKAKA